MTLRKSLSLVLLLALAGGVVAWSQKPPENLHLVGDHWTAWDPPTSHEEGAEIYFVRTGDTLWDLAERFYGNPYLWPQLWERNRYVLDAHWIYPGDPLVVGVEVTPIEQIAEVTDAAEAAGAEDAGEVGDGLNLDRSVSPPVPLGYDSDVDCSGFIGGLSESFDHHIIGSEYEALIPDLATTGQLGNDGVYGSIDTLKVDLATGDVVYLDSGLAGGLFPGTLYTVIQPRERVFEPGSRTAVMGRFYRQSGRLRVLSVQEETAIAEIVQTCMPINVGDGLVPYVAHPIPLVSRGLPTGINDPVGTSALAGAPRIVRSESRLFTIGQDHVVYVDRGEGEIEPGQIYTIYRRNKRGLPPVVIGEVGILKVHERSAVAKVIESRHAVYVGDLLSLKP